MPLDQLSPQSNLLTDIGLSSLQIVELRLMIEENLHHHVNGDLIAKAETVNDLVQLVLNTHSATNADLSDRDQAHDADREREPNQRELFLDTALRLCEFIGLLTTWIRIKDEPN